MRNLAHLLAYLAGRAEAETQTSPAEREAIARWATGRRCCVEIGVWHGVTTRRIREVMAADGVLTGVDPFPPDASVSPSRWPWRAARSRSHPTGRFAWCA